MSKKTQWEKLKQLGFSDKAAAVIMGHALAESGCECNRLQGDYSKDRAKSVEYTAKVDSGAISEYDFVYHAPNGGGYGWLQWTYAPRKEGLYDTAKGLGVSVGSEDAAIEWFWTEIHQAEYSKVWDALTGDGSIREMSDVFMKRFERPADQSESACAYRAQLCESMYKEFVKSVPVKDPVAKTFPPDPSIMILQMVLQYNGYWSGGITGYKSEEFFKQYFAFGEDMKKC